jgi:hypothetical protein
VGGGFVSGGWRWRKRKKGLTSMLSYQYAFMVAVVLWWECVRGR